ncbi:MAG: GyrI-like domain-containing protein [Anaerolineae bacterium]
MNKLDLRTSLKTLYHPSGREYSVVTVPPLNFLMIDGAGDPRSAQEYRDAVSTLYAAAYTLKFAVKQQQDIDFAVMPLEGLWWTADGLYDPHAPNRDNWRWTMMIVQPECVSAELVQQTIVEVQRKKNPPLIERLRFECYDEGLAAHILYTGAYADEFPTIEAMYRFMEGCGYAHNGKHHEIYLNAPNRVPPEKLKTIIRQPIRTQ